MNPATQYLPALLAMALAYSSVAAAEDEAQNIQSTVKTEVTEGYVTPEQIGTQDLDAKPEQQSVQRDNRNHQHSADIWVANINTYLFDDADNDGYYAGLTVSMDIDVEQDWADVFAQIYLQRNGSQPRLLHTTDVFSIFERASSDEYQVDVGLLDNTPAADYDLIIDVVNASTGQLVDSVSNQTHHNLAYLPLESSDYQYDAQVELSYGLQISGGNGNHNNIGLDYGFSVQSLGHGGATGLLGLLGLALAVGVRLRRGTHGSTN